MRRWNMKFADLTWLKTWTPKLILCKCFSLHAAHKSPACDLSKLGGLCQPLTCCQVLAFIHTVFIDIHVIRIPSMLYTTSYLTFKWTVCGLSSWEPFFLLSYLASVPRQTAKSMASGCDSAALYIEEPCDWACCKCQIPSTLNRPGWISTCC